MNILYVTSFAKDMYKSSGKALINSFIHTKQYGDLLVCYENFNFKDDSSKHIYGFDISKYNYLLKWLENNKDIIPKYLGGTATQKLMPKAFTPANRKASRWFRKIASLYYALNVFVQDKYDIIVWIDSDCYFKQQLPFEIYSKAFQNNAGVFYHLGLKRNIDDKGVESGFIGFYKKNNGFNFLQQLFDTYNTEFRKYNRWDDGYIIKMVINNNINLQNIKVNDLIFQESNSKYERNVLKLGIFGNYIHHNKGIHAKLQILV
jgi:hypothetical protein